MGLGNFTRELKKRGYLPDFMPGTEYLAYKKNWTNGKVCVPLLLVFEHGSPINFPMCFIKGWKGNIDLQNKLGIVNVSPDGKLCYVDDSNIWWDSSRDIEFTLAVIERIENLLLEKVNGNQEQITFHNNFIGYWNSDSNEILALSRMEEGNSYFISKDASTLYIHDSTIKAPGKLSRADINYISLPTVPVPSNYHRWPPKSLSDLSIWLQNDSKVFHNWSKCINHIIRAKKPKNGKVKELQLATVITFPTYIEVPNDLNQVLVIFKVSPQTIEACLAGRVQSLEILFRMEKYSKLEKYSIYNADYKYIYSRNNTSSCVPLENKKIVVVGAGTIGGYLASQLADSGAGTGKRGELTIIDKDVLKPENLSRHILGFNSINQNKAKAISDYLNLKNIHSDIKFIPTSFEDIISSLNPDIVVNATGMQSVGVNIERLYNNTIIHCWIEGNGAAVRTFTNTRTNGACFRCLWEIKNNGQVDIIHPVLKDNIINITPAACHESYIEYDSTAPITASILATQSINSYFKNKDTATLKTIIIEKEDCISGCPDLNPIKQKECPICN